jgi:hypothetical protein
MAQGCGVCSIHSSDVDIFSAAARWKRVKVRRNRSGSIIVELCSGNARKHTVEDAAFTFTGDKRTSVFQSVTAEWSQIKNPCPNSAIV